MPRRLLILLILPILLSLHACTTAPTPHAPPPTAAPPVPQSIAGQYRTMSESEWSIDLDLHPDGTAVIRTSSWLPGESHNATTKIHRGAWIRDGDIVTVRVNGHIEVLRYDENLGFAAFGQSGGGPGLVALSSAAGLDGTLLGQNQFWRVGVRHDTL